MATQHVKGPLSAYVNHIIETHHKRHTDQEIADALNESPAFKEAGARLNGPSVRERRKTLNLRTDRHHRKAKDIPSRLVLNDTLADVQSRHYKPGALVAEAHLRKQLGDKAFKSELLRALNVTLGADEQPSSFAELTETVRKILALHGFGHEEQRVTNVLLLDLLDEVYWNSAGRRKLLQDAVNAGLDDQKIKHILDAHTPGHDVPLFVVSQKRAETEGLTRAPRTPLSDIRGILRVALDPNDRHTAKEFRTQRADVPLEPNDEGEVRVALIAAPQLGLPYDKDIEANLTRCALSAARKSNCTHVVIGGGLMKLTLVKGTGPAKLLRDMLIAAEMSPESFSEAYRDEARQLMEDEHSLEPIYATAEELLNELLRGWYRVAMRTKRSGEVKAEFLGEILIVLSPQEEALARVLAHFWMLYEQRARLKQAHAERSVWESVIAEARKALVDAGRAGDEATLDSLRRKVREAETEHKRLDDLYNRVRVTNFEGERSRKVMDAALGYLIRRLEEHIPGARVVAIGSARFVIGSKVVEVICPTGRNPFYQVMGTYGPRQRAGMLADQTYLMHPGASYFRGTAREDYRAGTMMGAAHVFECPMLIDSVRVRAALTLEQVNDPTVRAVKDTAHRPGMLVLEHTAGYGLHQPAFYSTEYIRKLGIPRQRRKQPAYLWFMDQTDMHFGSSTRVRILTSEGIPIPIPEAVMQLVRASGIDARGWAPFVGIRHADDQVQAHNFGTEARPHPETWDTHELLDESGEVLRCAEHKHGKATVRKMKLMIQRMAHELWVRGVHNLTQQFKEWHRFLERNADVYVATLQRAFGTECVVRGASTITGKPATNDAGSVIIGSGNHTAKTTDYQLQEGELGASKLRSEVARLMGLPTEELRSSIVAPLMQDQTIAYGTLRDPSGYTYGMEVCSTPPKRDSWFDVLAGWVKVKKKTGNPSAVLAEPVTDFTVHTAGDKHFWCVAVCADGAYTMGPSSTHTDSFGYTAGGLPENNSGTAFLGLPVGGLANGPVRYEHLTADVIQEYTASGTPFPWRDFLPNPVGGWEDAD